MTAPSENAPQESSYELGDEIATQPEDDGREVLPRRRKGKKKNWRELRDERARAFFLGAILYCLGLLVAVVAISFFWTSGFYWMIGIGVVLFVFGFFMGAGHASKESYLEGQLYMRLPFYSLFYLLKNLDDKEVRFAVYTQLTALVLCIAALIGHFAGEVVGSFIPQRAGNPPFAQAPVPTPPPQPNPIVDPNPPIFFKPTDPPIVIKPKDPPPMPRVAPFRKPVPQPIDALTGQWSFGQIDDMIGVRDLSGRGNHGKLNGVQTVASTRGQVLSFTGDRKQSFDFGASADFNYDTCWNFTYAGWFLTTRDTGTILCQSSDKKSGIRIFVTGSKMAADICDDTDSPYMEVQQRSGVEMKLMKWHHFALVRSHMSFQLYLDGNAHHGAYGNAIGPITTQSRLIGSDPTARPDDHLASFVGNIGEIRVYQKALTPKEIMALAAAK